MRQFALLAIQALFAARTVTAQDQVADVFYYSTAECSGDPFSHSADIVFFEANKVLSGGTWSCSYGFSDLSAYNMSGSNYNIFVDRNTVPEGCSIVFYQGAPSGDMGSDGPCITFYSVLDHDDLCTSVFITETFGAAICCGDDCEAAPSPPPGKRALQDVSASKPAVRDGAASKPAVRDVTAMKRSNPLNPLNRRADCSFSGSGDSITEYGSQLVVGEISCPPSGSDCTAHVAITYGTSTTNSFGVSSEIGGTLFEIVSVSVSFSYMYSMTTDTSYTWTVDFPVPAGQAGQATFSPRFECTPQGSFSGNDCTGMGIPTGQDGTVCFPVFEGGNPAGLPTFVQTG